MDEQTTGPSVQDILAMVQRQRLLIVGVFSSVLLTALVGLFVVTPTYRAATKVLLTTNRAELSTSAEKASELVRQSNIADGEIASQFAIVRSSEVVRRVLVDMGISPESAPPSFFSRLINLPGRLIGKLYSWLHGLEDIEPADPLLRKAKAMAEGIDAGRVEKSNVIEIGFSGESPEWITDFVNRLAAAYVQRNGELRQVEAEDFFQRQSQVLSTRLAESEAALKAVRERAGALAGQQAEVHDRLNEFSSELARTRIALAEEQQRVEYLERVQAGVAKGGRMATPELLALEGKRAELLNIYRPDSEKIRDLDRQIDRLQRALASYDTVVSAGSDPRSTDILSARASLAALKGKEEALGKQRDEFQKQAVMLDSQSFDMQRLERQVKLDEEAYLSYVRTAEQSRLSNALERSKLLQLTILEPATVPGKPVSPKVPRVLILAMVVGVALGLGAGFAREQLDPTIKNAADVKRYGNLEVLTSLPERAA